MTTIDTLGFVYFQSKCEVIQVLKDFFSQVRNHVGASIEIMRSDNGTEFFNIKCNDLLSSLGIIHQSSYPYTP